MAGEGAAPGPTGMAAQVPERYRDPARSGLEVTVRKRSEEHDLTLRPDGP